MEGQEAGDRKGLTFHFFLKALAERDRPAGSLPHCASRHGRGRTEEQRQTNAGRSWTPLRKRSSDCELGKGAPRKRTERTDSKSAVSRPTFAAAFESARLRIRMQCRQNDAHVREGPVIAVSKTQKGESMDTAHLALEVVVRLARRISGSNDKCKDGLTFLLYVLPS